MNLDEPYVSGDEETDNSEDNDTVTEYVEALKGKNGNENIPFLRHYDWDEFSSAEENVSLHCLMVKFKVFFLKRSSFDDFLLFCNQQMQSAVCQNIEKATRIQADCKLWHTIRYARVTASKSHEVAHCHTTGGSLLEILFGAAPMVNTAAMKRGTRLEPQVRSTVSKMLVQKIKDCGIFIKSADPIFGASPDGIASDGSFIIEIKCPISDKTLSGYIGKNREIGKKFFAQMQLQMHLTDVHQSKFCVADPKFNVDVATTGPLYNNNVIVIDISYDKIFTFDLLEKCKLYWRKNVFPKLYDSVKIK